MMSYVAARSRTVKTVEDLIAYNAADAAAPHSARARSCCSWWRPCRPGMSRRRLCGPRGQDATGRHRDAGDHVQEALAPTCWSASRTKHSERLRHRRLPGDHRAARPAHQGPACCSRPVCRPSACRWASPSSARPARMPSCSPSRTRSSRRPTCAFGLSCPETAKQTPGVVLMSFLKQAFATVALLLAAGLFATPATAQQGCRASTRPRPH